MFTKIKNQRGFVLIEFVIALPLVALLIYALAQMIMQLPKFSTSQAADYALENDAHEILTQITRDARAATYAKVRKAVGNEEIYEIFFYYSVLSATSGQIVNLKTPHRFTVGATETHGYQVYAERLEDGAKRNPISGGNFFADTTVRQLKFSQPSEKVLHITLEVQSISTNRKFKVSTSVFMPACEEIVGIEDE